VWTPLTLAFSVSYITRPNNLRDARIFEVGLNEFGLGKNVEKRILRVGAAATVVVVSLEEGNATCDDKAFP